MPWHAQLDVLYALRQGRTVVQHQHEGPLRLLQSLYPEGDAICHNVLVHPPGGLVGGDTLTLNVDVTAGAHALLTTPGATRFYRSEGDPATQCTHLRVAANSRLEWLPLEALCYSGCQAHNQLRMELQPGAEMLGWDVTSLGLPLASQPFAEGWLQQHIELPGVWLERARVAAGDTRLLDSPLGLAGHRCLATVWFAAGSPMSRDQRETALEAARTLLPDTTSGTVTGVTSPNPQVVVVRVLAPVVEPAMQLLRAVRSAWRTALWGLPDHTPRIWAM